MVWRATLASMTWGCMRRRSASISTDHLETKWSTDKQECFAIVRADTHFDSAWIVHHFTAETIPVQMWEAEGELASVVEALARRHGAPRTRFWSSAV